MEAYVWGCRGSLAAPGGHTVRYGGNTSCVEILPADGSVIVLDAGTGLRELGRSLIARPRRPIHLLLTHLHLDHLEGLGFFAPVWEAGSEIHVWGPPSPVRSLEERIARYFSPPLFPVHLSDLPATITFDDAPDGPWTIGSTTVTAQPVEHPDPTLGYRLDEGGSSLAYIPDHEPALGVDLDALTPDWISGFSIAQGASVLLHDSQYTEAEYEGWAGRGHSSVAAAVTFARKAGVGRLLLFHHDPLHSDEELLELEARARELWGPEGTPPELAHEGMTIQVSAQAAQAAASA